MGIEVLSYTYQDVPKCSLKILRRILDRFDCNQRALKKKYDVRSILRRLPVRPRPKYPRKEYCSQNQNTTIRV